VSSIHFNEHRPKKSRGFTTLAFLAVLGAMIGILALGTTFASNININTGSAIEFGQGVAQTTACDHEIRVTPSSTFVNDTPGEFKFTSITLSGLDSTDSVDGSLEGCQGKSFSIKAYKKSGELIPQAYLISVGADSFSSGNGLVTSTFAGSADSSVTLTFDSPTILASDVYRITLESQSLEETLFQSNLILYLDATSPSSLENNSSTIWKSISPATSNLSSIGFEATSSAASSPGSVSFPTRGSYVNLGKDNEANVSGDMTVESWIKISSLSSEWNLIATHFFDSPNTQNGSPDWHFSIYGNHLDLVSVDSRGYWGWSDGAHTFTIGDEGIWMLVGFTLDNNTCEVQFYLNGEKDGKVHSSRCHSPSSNVILELGDGRGIFSFVGNMSKFRLYDKALTPAAMLANYNSEKANY
jgi:Concanavalin A-like lectin/glucanases superfamily